MFENGNPNPLAISTMPPLAIIDDNELVAVLKALFNVMKDHPWTSRTFPREEFGNRHLCIIERATHPSRKMSVPELNSLLHTLRYRVLNFPSVFNTVDRAISRTSMQDVMALSVGEWTVSKVFCL